MGGIGIIIAAAAGGAAIAALCSVPAVAAALGLSSVGPVAGGAFAGA